MTRPALSKLFQFLESNHHIHARIQKEDVGNCLHARRTVQSRAYLLLYRALMTQSKPRLSETKKFFEAVEEAKPLRSMRSFQRFLSEPEGVFEGLVMQPGWGSKTAALFLRNLAVIRQYPTLKERFWADLDLMAGQRIRLPVDAVILEIFAKLGPSLEPQFRPDFKSINDLLHAEGYSNRQMMIWDDLWFWGFVTQRSSFDGAPRQHGWNEEKYWSILNAPKSAAAIAEVRTKAARFMGIVADAGATKQLIAA